MDSEILIMDVNKSRIRHKILFTSRFPSLLVSNQNLKSITVVADLSFGKVSFFPCKFCPQLPTVPPNFLKIALTEKQIGASIYEGRKIDVND